MVIRGVEPVVGQAHDDRHQAAKPGLQAAFPAGHVGNRGDALFTDPQHFLEQDVCTAHRPPGRAHGHIIEAAVCEKPLEAVVEIGLYHADMVEYAILCAPLRLRSFYLMSQLEHVEQVDHQAFDEHQCDQCNQR